MPPKKVKTNKRIISKPYEAPGHFGRAAKKSTKPGAHLAVGSWARTTLSGYSSGLSKYIAYVESTGKEFDEGKPINNQDIYGFVTWAGRTRVDIPNPPKKPITAKTIDKYLDGINAWHIVKHLRKIKLDTDIVKMLLRATRREEEGVVLESSKKPVKIEQLYELLLKSHGKSEVRTLVADIALVAFWGMMRLGEIFRGSKVEGAVLNHHVEFGKSKKGEWAKIHLRKGKTAKPNEIQIIHLQTQPSVLDPVKALKRIMNANPQKGREALLFQSEEGILTKKAFIREVEKIWGRSSLEKWSGHSFRVGGASLRANLGSSENTIKRVGRWKSDSYLRYIKEFTEKEIAETKEFLDTINLRT